MKLTVLCDNNTIIDNYLLGEPGVSYYLLESGKSILFDLGYSDVFLKNAEALGIDLRKLDYVVFSHGHNDHTRGIISLNKFLDEVDYIKPALLVHPEAIEKKYYDGIEIGYDGDIAELSTHFDVQFRKEPFWITERLVFLGEIERVNDFENKKPIGQKQTKAGFADDFVLDDTALVYKGIDGLVIITGCSHSGICNIIEYAMKVCEDDRIFDIIGGLHLLKPDDTQLSKTLAYLKETGVERVHACHCTDFFSKCSLAKITDVNEVGAGLVIEYR